MKYRAKKFNVEWIKLIGTRIDDNLLINRIDAMPQNGLDNGYIVELVVEFMPTYIDVYLPGIMPPETKREYLWPLADMALYEDMKKCLTPLIEGD